MEAWVTLATNDSYAVGALTLAHSLKRVQTTRKVVIMITEEVSSSMKAVLEDVFDAVFTVEPLDSGDLAHLTLLDRTELGITFTKVGCSRQLSKQNQIIRSVKIFDIGYCSSFYTVLITQLIRPQIQCWTLTDFSKCVFLDADTLLVQNSDELFDREEFSAAPDAGWPDCFNSGVFVFRPDLNTFRELVKHAMASGSFDGGDQGLLNTFYSSWATRDISRHLPFTYNMVASATYSYLPAYKHFGHNVKIVHFIGELVL